MEKLAQIEYRGIMTTRSGEKIPRGFATSIVNGDQSSSSQTGPEKGYSLFGNQSNPDNKTTRRYTYERGNGVETMLQVRDDASNNILEVLHPGDIRNSEDGEWLILVSGLTTGKQIDFTPFNDTGTDNLLFCDGVGNFSRWSGAMCVIDGALSAAAATVPVKKITGDPKTNATDGFPASGSFIYRDTTGTYKTITYTGKTASSFTGCSGVTATADNTGVMQAADTTTYSAVNKNNVLGTAQGKVWGTGNPAQPTVLDFSAVSDFTDWTADVNPNDPGARDFPEGGKNTVLAFQDDWVFVGKEKAIFAYKIVYQTATARSELVKKISDIGIANQKSVALVGNEWWFVSPEGRIGRILRLESEGLFQVEDITELIKPTLENAVWDDAVIEYFPKRNKLIVAYKMDSNSSQNDRALDIQISVNEEGNKVLNFGLLDWYISDMCLYNKDLYHGSGAESECFKSFDGWSKNGGPYEWNRLDRVENFGNFEAKEVFYHEVVGLIGPGTTLIDKVHYGENAYLGTIEKSIAFSDGEPWVVSQALNTLGAFELGINPLGGALLEDIEDLSFFHVYFSLPNEYRPFVVQREFETIGTGQRVIILKDIWHFDYSEEDINSELKK